MGEQYRRHRVQPHRLLHHGLEVRQARGVGLLDGFFAAESAVELSAHPGHGARVPEQLGHRPLDRDRDGVAPGGEDVEQDGRQVVTSDLAGGQELEERVEEVAVRVPGRGGLGQPAVDYAIQNTKDLLVAPACPAAPSLQVEPPEEREDVRDVGLR